MKYKLLLFIFLLPFVVNAANTNVFDRVLIRSTFQFTGGTPGLNKVLTSDAAGFYTPTSLIALEATLITNVTTTAPFLSISGQGTHTLAIAPVGTVITNNASPSFNGLTVNGNSTFGINSSSTETHNGITQSYPNGANFNGGAFTIPPSTSGTITNGSAGFLFQGTSFQIGTNASAVLTLGGITITAPSGLNINAGVQTFPATTAGTTTNGSATALYLGSLQTSSAGGIDTIAGAGTNFVISANAGGGFLFLKGRFTTQTNVLGSVAVANTLYTNPTQQRADVKTGFMMPAGGQMQIWVANAGLTNKSVFSNPASTATWTNSTAEIMVDPGATVLYTNIIGVTVLDNQYSVTHYH